MNDLVITPTTGAELAKAIKDKEPDDVITFQGVEILVSYGRYLVEYLTEKTNENI
jgi:hypothetical protein